MEDIGNEKEHSYVGYILYGRQKNDDLTSIQNEHHIILLSTYIPHHCKSTNFIKCQHGLSSGATKISIQYEFEES